MAAAGSGPDTLAAVGQQVRLLYASEGLSGSQEVTLQGGTEAFSKLSRPYFAHEMDMLTKLGRSSVAHLVPRLLGKFMVSLQQGRQLRSRSYGLQSHPLP